MARKLPQGQTDGRPNRAQLKGLFRLPLIRVGGAPPGKISICGKYYNLSGTINGKNQYD